MSSYRKKKRKLDSSNVVNFATQRRERKKGRGRNGGEGKQFVKGLNPRRDEHDFPPGWALVLRIRTRKKF